VQPKQTQGIIHITQTKNTNRRAHLQAAAKKEKQEAGQKNSSKLQQTKTKRMNTKMPNPKKEKRKKSFPQRL
jgi:uncharacterized protein YcbK (DUF882 family)